MVNFPKLSQHFIQPQQLIQKIQQRFLIVKSITKETVVNNFIITIAKIDQILSKIYESFEQIKGIYANVLKILNLGNCSEKAMLVIIFLI